MNLKFSSNPTVFTTAIKRVITAAARASALPILGHVIVEVKADFFRVTCTDMEVTLRAGGAATNLADEGSVTVQVRKVYDIVRALPSDAGEILFELKGDMLRVSQGKSWFLLRTLPVDEFPEVPAIDDATHIRLPAATFRALLSKVRYAMANGDVRVMLNGMLIEAEGQCVTCVGTNGHRMAVACEKLAEPVATPIKAVVPRKAVEVLAGLLEGVDAQVDLELTPRHCRLVLSECGLVASLIDAAFPDYKAVLPRNLPHSIKADRATLLDAVRRVSIVAADTTSAITLVPGRVSLRLSAADGDAKGGTEEVAAECSECDANLGLNANYLSDALGAIEVDDITVELKDSTSSILVTPRVHDGSGHVIMPVRL